MCNVELTDKVFKNNEIAIVLTIINQFALLLGQEGFGFVSVSVLTIIEKN